MRIATATAHSNIAFVKYWGNRDDELRLPVNDSLSMGLSGASSTTTVAFDAALTTDKIVLDGRPAAERAAQRVSRHLDLVRGRAGSGERALVVSSNTFPAGTGIASSASGFAALTVAACAALDLALDERALSALARRGSGSAARSIPAGFVEWLAADADEASYARSIAPPQHWDLHDVVAIVSREHKAVGSSDGHRAAQASPYFGARLSEIGGRFERIRRAVLDRDLERLGTDTEAEAISLHVVAMTGDPPLLYWHPSTVALLHRVRAWRAVGLPTYFTLDAGPNVHLLCEGAHAAELTRELGELPYVEAVIDNAPAGPARQVASPGPEALVAYLD